LLWRATVPPSHPPKRDPGSLSGGTATQKLQDKPSISPTEKEVKRPITREGKEVAKEAVAG